MLYIHLFRFFIVFTSKAPGVITGVQHKIVLGAQERMMSPALSISLLCSLQVFTRECMSHYLRVFNFLWRAKRMEYILTDIRKGHMCNAKLLRNLPGSRPPTASAAQRGGP